MTNAMCRVVLLRNHNRAMVVISDVMMMREYGSFEMNNPITLMRIWNPASKYKEWSTVYQGVLSNEELENISLAYL
jgi:hypothetical protein